MYQPIIVHKSRTNVVTLSLDADISDDTLTSEIRSEPNSTSDLLATWTIAPVTDGSDGLYTMTLDDSALTAIVHSTGYMDIKRVSSGEPLPLFDDPLPVLFKDSVTA